MEPLKITGQPLEEINALFTDGFQISDVLEAAKIGARAASDFATLSGDEKRALVKSALIQAVESVDHLLPVIGPWMDFPWMDVLEERGIGWCVDQALNTVADAGFRNARVDAIKAGDKPLAQMLGVQ
jgi:hypothetical protein